MPGLTNATFQINETSAVEHVLNGNERRSGDAET
jgi:hypothetical protein